MSLQVASEMAGGVGASATNATSFSYNFDCKGGSLLVVGSSAASSVNTQGISAVTYAGASLGSADVVDSNSNANKTTVTIHHKAGPAGGVNLVAVSVSGGTSNAIVSGAISFVGGSSNAAIAQKATADDGAVAGTTASVTVNGTTQGNVVLAVAAAGDALSAPTQTASWTKNVDAVTGGDNGAGQRAAGGGTIAFSWTIATSNLWAVAAVEVAADPAPGPRPLGPARRPGSKPNPTTRFTSTLAKFITPAPAFDPSTSPWNPVLPDRHPAVPWRPERTEAARAGWTQALWAVPPVKIPEPVLPDRFARPVWSPERSWSVSVPLIVVTSGFFPTLPDAVRPAWRPERTETFWPPFQFAVVTVPTWGYEVLGAQRLAPWSPQRTETPWNPLQFAAPTVPTWGYESLGARLPPPWTPDRGQALWNPLQIVAPAAPTWGYEVLGSQTNHRAPWNPERSYTVSQPYILPRLGATVVLPDRFAFPRWNPERSAALSVPFVIPSPGYAVVLPGAYTRPPWSPERSGTAFPVRIAPAPPLSWRPELLERYIARWRAPPNLDLWLPPFPTVLVPSVVLFLLGRQDAYALLGRQDLITLLGRQDLIVGVGRPDSYLITGRQDAYSIPGGNMPLSAILKIPLGDDVTVAMTLQNADQTAFNLTACTITVGIKKYLTDSAALISKTIANGGVVVTNAAGGLANLILSAADTASLGAGDYPFDVQVTNGSGKKATLLAGTITLTDHPTR